MMVTINDVGVSFVCLFNVCLLNKVHNLTTLYQFSNFYYHYYVHWFIVTDVPYLELLDRPVCPICLLHSEGLLPAIFFRKLPGFLGPLSLRGWHVCAFIPIIFFNTIAISSSSCAFPFPLRQPTARERWCRSVRTLPPSNSASRQTGSSQVKSLPGYFPSPWHFPQSLTGFPRSTSLTNHLDRKSPLKVSFWGTGSKSSAKAQSLEITGRDLKSHTQRTSAFIWLSSRDGAQSISLSK